MTLQRFRFLPRFKNLARAAIAVGIVLFAASLAVAIQTGLFRWSTLFFPCVGVVLGGLYLSSSTWTWLVEVDSAKLVVRSPSELKATISWKNIIKVIYSEDNQTLFIKGHNLETSFIVPGPGLSAPYLIEDKDKLIATILDMVATEKIVFGAPGQDS